MNWLSLTRHRRLSTILPRSVVAGRLIVYLVMLRVVFVAWQNGPEPFNVLILVIPGLLFLIDGDRRESIGGAGPVVVGRAKATGGVAVIAIASAAVLVVVAETGVAHPLIRPLAVMVTLSIVALAIQSVRRAAGVLTNMSSG